MSKAYRWVMALLAIQFIAAVVLTGSYRSPRVLTLAGMAVIAAVIMLRSRAPQYRPVTQPWRIRLPAAVADRGLRVEVAGGRILDPGTQAGITIAVDERSGSAGGTARLECVAQFWRDGKHPGFVSTQVWADTVDLPSAPPGAEWRVAIGAPAEALPTFDAGTRPTLSRIEWRLVVDLRGEDGDAHAVVPLLMTSPPARMAAGIGPWTADSRYASVRAEAAGMAADLAVHDAPLDLAAPAVFTASVDGAGAGRVTAARVEIQSVLSGGGDPLPLWRSDIDLPATVPGAPLSLRADIPAVNIAAPDSDWTTGGDPVQRRGRLILTLDTDDGPRVFTRALSLVLGRPAGGIDEDYMSRPAVAPGSVLGRSVTESAYARFRTILMAVVVIALLGNPLLLVVEIFTSPPHPAPVEPTLWEMAFAPLDARVQDDYTVYFTAAAPSGTGPQLSGTLTANLIAKDFYSFGGSAVVDAGSQPVSGRIVLNSRLSPGVYYVTLISGKRNVAQGSLVWPDVLPMPAAPAPSVSGYGAPWSMSFGPVAGQEQGDLAVFFTLDRAAGSDTGNPPVAATVYISLRGAPPLTAGLRASISTVDGLSSGSFRLQYSPEPGIYDVVLIGLDGPQIASGKLIWPRPQQVPPG